MIAWGNNVWRCAVLICMVSFCFCSVAPRYRSEPEQWIRSGAPQEEEEGIASYYGTEFHGRPTASGEIFDMYKISAAHQLLPLGTTVKVINLENSKSLVVRINDRGPFIKGRIIDLSYAAAVELGFEVHGTAQVRIEVIEWGRE